MTRFCPYSFEILTVDLHTCIIIIIASFQKSTNKFFCMENILKQPYTDLDNYRWDNEYILPYETQASILERFKLFNYVNGSVEIQHAEQQIINGGENQCTENIIFDEIRRRDGYQGAKPRCCNRLICPG